MGAPDGTARLASGNEGRMARFRVAEPLFPLLPIVADPGFPVGDAWFADHAAREQLLVRGFRSDTGGTHLSRTMMLAELRRVLEAEAQPTPEHLRSLVLDENVLQKRTGSARRLSLRHLRELYGFGAPPPVLRAMIGLWPRAGEGQPMVALLGALAREVLLRDSAEVVLAAPPGARVRAADLRACSRSGIPVITH
jgi:hypothetical protein